VLKNINVVFLKNIILEVNPRARDRNINSKTNLFEERFLDSYSVIQLVNAIEERTGIAFDYGDLKAAYFRNLDSLQGLLVDKYGLSVVGPKKKKAQKKAAKKT
jgi:acyl carrier protein